MLEHDNFILPAPIGSPVTFVCLKRRNEVGRGAFENLRAHSKVFFPKGILLLIHNDQVESIESALPCAAASVAPGETN